MNRFVILLLLFSCGRQQPSNLDNATLANNKALYDLLDQLPTLHPPLTFKSGQLIRNSLIVDDNELTTKISKIIPGFNPLGKIYQTENFIAVVGIVPADIATPVLSTYNKNGEEIDSFFMYPTAGVAMGYYSTNTITLNENKELFLIDSTLIRKINKEGTDEVLGTDSLSVTKKKFRINDKGEIHSD